MSTTPLSIALAVGLLTHEARSSKPSLGKFHRFICNVELSPRRHQRVNCQDFVCITHAEMARFNEMSSMPLSITCAFRREFAHADEMKTDVCNGRVHT